jgi:hypothetical protein
VAGGVSNFVWGLISPSNIFKKNLKKPKNHVPWGQISPPPRILFFLIRSTCKNLKPYDNHFWDFNNGK